MRPVFLISEEMAQEAHDSSVNSWRGGFGRERAAPPRARREYRGRPGACAIRAPSGQFDVSGRSEGLWSRRAAFPDPLAVDPHGAQVLGGQAQPGLAPGTIEEYEVGGLSDC